ncbi:MAG: Rieske 2Fe-2S domain-containing protein [Thaumarchaeota archaeon]|nr:Rieske 2Fe-2S domain-containing protein [Nitrososphaerota archaeon]RNJ71324.1 MAG: non-heme iron oxygenase ferredoxin subunit [Thaumarchaeota archaeon S14]RNJ71803.1 MAG: non-heme iron oxygenase ferredoxin subunit [Thaumarchaeota archaeon S15]RNJ72105.1 MAG: non-heme iron oxygenase ferredoxin subunit [Thaumarchaeota archaeon S13]MDD9812707.1 Rieske 2Fe-2S domain-containing protein [Nitrososphaerota archaeon]
MARVVAGKAAEIPPGTLKRVGAEGGDIVVGNLDGKFFAMADTCTHAGASLSEGRIEGGNVVCGWHGAQFECASGRLAKFPAKVADLRQYGVSVEGDDVVVEV